MRCSSRNTRFFRIPYKYITDILLVNIIKRSSSLTRNIRMLHDNRIDLSFNFNDRDIKAYMACPAFLVLCRKLAVCELQKRKLAFDFRVRWYEEDCYTRPLSDWLPPTDKDMADDALWLLNKLQYSYSRQRTKIPQSYVTLIQKYYHGYTPPPAVNERIDTVSGTIYHADRHWYRVQG